MNAKVMKDFVEGKNGQTAEYVSTNNIINNKATLTFSNTPLFISFVMINADDNSTMHSASVSYSQSATQFLCPVIGSANYTYDIKFFGNTVEITGLYGVKKIDAIGFF